MFFFFKQKTAYEMRISDWSSDVCSSDLFDIGFEGRARSDRAELQPPVDLAADIDVGGTEAVARDKRLAGDRAFERVERGGERAEARHPLLVDVGLDAEMLRGHRLFDRSRGGGGDRKDVV